MLKNFPRPQNVGVALLATPMLATPMLATPKGIANNATPDSLGRALPNLRGRRRLDRPGIQNEGAIAAMDQDKVQHVERAYRLYSGN